MSTLTSTAARSNCSKSGVQRMSRRIGFPSNRSRATVHRDKKRPRMEVRVHGPLKLVSYVIVLLMALAVLYAAYISVTYWTGIGV